MPRRMYKYRLYPSKAQIKLLEEQLELCQIVYNQLLDYCKQQYKENGKIPSKYELNKVLLTRARAQHPRERTRDTAGIAGI